ncbi:HD domain-containing protein [Bradyrhizobium murdochi]|uniref:HD domain-containing protein n=1 Tax=Bradyrhizobium murdochi TaxID=1038859 RepID=UPI000414B7EB|nr:ATP-binding protein [Bradyrhizobium murdochi]
MSATLDDVHLWMKSLKARPNDLHEKERDRLRVSFFSFRTRVAILASQIQKAFPNLTVHDVTHLDALWETADLIAGPEYPLNAMEGFVFGGAALLHDAALCFEAYEGGVDGIRHTTQWRDALAAEKDAHANLTEDELIFAADFSAVRALHAEQAAHLVDKAWLDPDTRQPLFLIDDSDLRKRYGPIIGMIASSHHWPIEDVASKLQHQVNAPGDWPSSWRIDPVKIACLLRCADAAHIDNRRAPDFLYALLRRSGISRDHWQAQNWLARPDTDQADPSAETIIYTSNRDFEQQDADAWWVAYDAITLVDAEIRSANALLRARPQNVTSPPFKIQRVGGSSSPDLASAYIRVRNWNPWSAKLHVGNVERLVRNIGGESLYGAGSDKTYVALREMLQNARDAIIARRKMDPNFAGGAIRVRVRRRKSKWVLEVEDNGVGMSETTMTGPLLDFGTSFWTTSLVQTEFPGLRASGFKSVGQYGIGFYSIFMISNNVSISSRRWDRGLDTLCQMKFPRGLTLRPIVTLAPDPSFGGDTSTIVSCVLHDDLLDDQARIFVTSGILNEPNYHLKLEDYIAVLSAGLDVSIHLQVDDGNMVEIHRPISKIIAENDYASWLQQIALTSYRPTDLAAKVESDAFRLRPLRSRGQIVGLAAIDLSPNIHGFNVRSVGGLATSVSGRGATGYVGFIDYSPGSAKREGRVIVAADADLKEWGSEQFQLLDTASIDPISWCIATCGFSDLGIDPTPRLHALFVATNGAMVLQLSDIFTKLQSAPLALLKAGMMNHLDSYVERAAFEEYLTFVPIKNSRFLSLEGLLPPIEGHPAAPYEFSFVECLRTYCEQKGRKLVYELRKNVRQSVLGPADAVILSLN